MTVIDMFAARSTARVGAGDLRALNEEGVSRLLMPPFWRGAGIDKAMAARYAALSGLMAFNCIHPWTAVKIDRKDWRPGGANVVIIEHNGETQTRALSPEVVEIVERYLKIRKRPKGCACDPKKTCICGPLFTSRNGGRVTPMSVKNGFDRAAVGIGAAVPIPDMLLAFCERQLTKFGDPDEVRRFMGYRTKGGPLSRPLPPIGIEQLARLAKRSARWFGPFERDRTSDDRMAAALARPGSVPAHRGVNLVRKTSGLPYLTASEHPLVARLAGIERPSDPKLLKDLQKKLRKENLAELYGLVRTRKMPVAQAAELVLDTPHNFRSMCEYHFRGGRLRLRRKPHRPKPPRPKRRTRATPVQARFIAGLKARTIPEDKAMRLIERQARIAAHFPDVDKLAAANIVSIELACRLLDVTRTVWQRLRAAAKVGFPVERVVAEQRFAPITAEWRARIELEYQGHDGDDREFYFRMRLLGFEGGEDVVTSICKRLRTAAAAPAGDVEAFVSELTSFAWSEDPAGQKAQRGELITRHLERAAELVRLRNLSSSDVQKLFRIERGRCDFFLAALKAGLPIEQATRDRDWHDLAPEDWAPALEALRSATPQEPLRQTYFRAVLAGFPGSEAQFRTGAARWLARGGAIPNVEANDP